LNEQIKEKNAEIGQLVSRIQSNDNKLNQAQSQADYLEEANKLMLRDVNNSKIGADGLNKEKSNMASQIRDLQEENEQLYRNEERMRRMVDELTAAKGQMNKRDREIDDLDARVRKITEDRGNLETLNEKLQR
jgi:chromosome segregation ATPase